jgi:hypothetical protein
VRFENDRGGRVRDPASLYQRAAVLGISPSTVYGRMARKGWDAERALTAPVVKHDHGLTSAARQLRIHPDTVRSRLRRGWPLRQALGKPVDARFSRRGWCRRISER